jgi:ABC-type branched-subunit amino acid transport system permease subunit
VAVLIAIAMALCVAALRRRFLGMEFLAARGNERGAAASGVSLVRAKLTAFAISSFIAGIGGGLLAYQVGRVSPASFSPLQSAFVVAFAYMGGIGSIAGAFLAGLLAPLGLLAAIIGISNNWIGVLGGLGVMQLIVTHPDGLAGIPQQLREHRERRRLSALTRSVSRETTGPSGGSAPLVTDEVEVR